MTVFITLSLYESLMQQFHNTQKLIIFTSERGNIAVHPTAIQ